MVRYSGNSYYGENFRKQPPQNTSKLLIDSIDYERVSTLWNGFWQRHIRVINGYKPIIKIINKEQLTKKKKVIRVMGQFSQSPAYKSVCLPSGKRLQFAIEHGHVYLISPLIDSMVIFPWVRKRLPDGLYLYCFSQATVYIAPPQVPGSRRAQCRCQSNLGRDGTGQAYHPLVLSTGISSQEFPWFQGGIFMVG